MSDLYNDQIEERVYEIGYDKGYEDCRSEIEMKLNAVLRHYIYSEKYTSPFELCRQIDEITKKKVVQVG